MGRLVLEAQRGGGRVENYASAADHRKVRPPRPGQPLPGAYAYRVGKNKNVDTVVVLVDSVGYILSFWGRD